MKKAFLIIIILAFSLNAMTQIKSISFSIGAGHTIVDLNEAAGVDVLEDWDNIGAMFKISADYQLNNKFLLVGEVGSNRLYYWEYYWNDGYYSGYRFGSEWTTNVGVHAKNYFSERFFGQGGLAIHVFNGGSGVVPGAVVQLGYNFPTAGKFSIPVLFRIESIMGTGFPFSIMLGSGFTFNLSTE